MSQPVSWAVTNRVHAGAEKNLKSVVVQISLTENLQKVLLWNLDNYIQIKS